MTMTTDTLTMVRRQIAANVPTLSNPDSIQPGQPLYELGIDSLAAVSLMVGLAAEANVDLEDFADALDQPATVEDLCKLAALFLTSRALDVVA